MLLHSQTPRGWRRGWMVVLLVAAIWPGFALAGATPSEYQVKAAFIYNFAKFVEWPLASFATPESPLVVVVVGDDLASKDIDSISGRLVGTHPIEVQWIPMSRADQLLQDVPTCHLLYILPSERAGAALIVQQVRTHSILTVCDAADDFARVGAAINLIKTADDKVRFEINVDAARRAGLKIQSPLLNLARIVREP